MKEKKEIRRYIKSLKEKQTREEILTESKTILLKVESTQEFKESNTILMFWSMDDEIYTVDFINKWYKSKTILLPCIVGDDLILKQYNGEDSLIEGEKYGIPEPNTEEFKNLELLDLIITPGVAFDKNLNRMGRGKGFYDKLLKQTNSYKIGIAFSYQILDYIPTEEHDVKMNQILY
ncbi:MAG: 5-formyltetrahydrofolate cyclo-ligase [Marinifilaceae bacterium]|jgi:5-formyltetrahydrofolate cyclo-ligase|nr:5-formyltetrahydrofolate cyclo-ligase [Marinifilaceae bacterium]